MSASSTADRALAQPRAGVEPAEELSPPTPPAPGDALRRIVGEEQTGETVVTLRLAS
jgi:hypothetical protein